MKVIGIDPSLTATGVASADGVTTLKFKTASDERLRHIHQGVKVTAASADLVVIEDLLFHTPVAGKLGMVHGVVRLALMELSVPYVVIAPSTLKKFVTGRGGATKADMRMELWKRAELDLRDDNQVDAWWLRQAGLTHYHLADVVMPKDRIEALTKADWTGAPLAGGWRDRMVADGPLRPNAEQAMS